MQLQYAVIYVPFPFRPSAKRQHRRSRHIQHGADDEAAAALRMGLQAAEAAAAARPPSRLRSRSHSQHSLLAMGAAGSRSR